MSSTNSISFDELVKGRESTVRFTVDMLLYAVELVMVMTGSDRHDSAQSIRRLTEEIFPQVCIPCRVLLIQTRKQFVFLCYLLVNSLILWMSCQNKFIVRRQSTRGGHPTKLISFQDAIELIMVLPGKVARESRIQFADVIKRFIKGDESMHAELEQNKAQGVPKTCELLFKSVVGKKTEPSIPRTRYIYATYSEAFKGQVKIGRATNVKARISSGNTMCAPKPHKIIAVAPTFDYKRDEAMAHNYFAAFRTFGEFFAISHLDAASFLADQITSLYHRELNAFMRDLSESEVDEPETYESLCDELEKELVAEKMKVEVLTRQRADSDRRIQQLEAGQADLKTGQADLKTAQAVLQADLKAGQADLKADLKAGQAVLQADIKAGQVEMMAFLRNTRPSL